MLFCATKDEQGIPLLLETVPVCCGGIRGSLYVCSLVSKHSGLQGLCPAHIAHTDAPRC